MDTAEAEGRLAREHATDVTPDRGLMRPDFTPDGRRLALAATDSETSNQDPAVIQFWDVEGRRELLESSATPPVDDCCLPPRPPECGPELINLSLHYNVRLDAWLHPECNDWAVHHLRERAP